MAKTSFPDKFTTNSIISYMASSHDLSKKEAKDIYDNLMDCINAGLMKGARVPVGNFGKMFIKIKPATKERLGRNPATGEEITIKAKPATKVPKFSFKKSFKEDSKKASLK